MDKGIDKNPVRVPRAVADGLNTVRDSGKTNMFDIQAVYRLCLVGGHYKAAAWIEQNPKQYATLLFNGLEIDE